MNIKDYIFDYDTNYMYLKKDNILYGFLKNKFFNYFDEDFDYFILDLDVLKMYDIIKGDALLLYVNDVFFDIYKCKDLNVNNEEKYKMILKLNKNTATYLDRIFHIPEKYYQIYLYANNFHLNDTYFDGTIEVLAIIVEYFISDILTKEFDKYYEKIKHIL